MYFVYIQNTHSQGGCGSERRPVIFQTEGSRLGHSFLLSHADVDPTPSCLLICALVFVTVNAIMWRDER